MIVVTTVAEGEAKRGEGGGTREERRRRAAPVKRRPWGC